MNPVSIAHVSGAACLAMAIVFALAGCAYLSEAMGARLSYDRTRAANACFGLSCGGAVMVGLGVAFLLIG